MRKRHRIFEGEDLESYFLFAFLAALHAKGETSDELLGFCIRLMSTSYHLSILGLMRTKLSIYEVLMPIQQEMHDIQDSIEQTALELYKNDPELVKKFLTDYTGSLMKDAEKTYRELYESFLFETNNNNIRIKYQYIRVVNLVLKVSATSNGRVVSPIIT